MTITVSAKLDPYQMDARTIQRIKTGCSNRTIPLAALMLNQDFRSSAGGLTLAAMSYESQLENRITSLLMSAVWFSVTFSTLRGRLTLETAVTFIDK